MDTVPMTQSGYAKIRAEIQELVDRMPDIRQQIFDAREKGDLRENAEYHAAKESLAMLEAKISQLVSKLANSYVVNESQAPEGKVCLGRTIKIKRVKDGKEFSRTLVGEGEADVGSGKILCVSPIGKAVISHQVGDLVTVNLPSGPVEFEILEIS